MSTEAERPTAPEAPNAWWIPLTVLAAIAAVLLVAPHLPTPGTERLYRWDAYASSLVFFLLVAQFCRRSDRVRAVSRAAVITLVCGALAAVIVLNLADVEIASDIAKIAFGAVAGMSFVRAIERPWWFLPICVCVPLADAWSVFSSQGVTRAVVNKAADNRNWLDWPTIATPIGGLPYEFFGRIGIVDIIFLTLFLGAADRFGLGVRRGLIALPLAFVATNVIAFEGWVDAVPALPLLCLAFLGAYGAALWRDLRADLARR